MTYKIQRRLPMGFMGDWGRLFKRYAPEIELRQDGAEIIALEDDRYVDIGEHLQFKRADDAKWEIKQEIKGAMGNAHYIIAKTTDAYWDSKTQQYECIVAPLDVVRVFGKEWQVKTIVTKVKHAPNPLKFFYMALESLEDINKK